MKDEHRFLAAQLLACVLEHHDVPDRKQGVIQEAMAKVLEAFVARVENDAWETYIGDDL